MKSEAILYHDGCNVCLSVVDAMQKLVDPSRFDLKIINLDVERERTADAEMQGVRQLPSLVLDGAVMEISPHSPIEEFYEQAV
jgi:hypothetical protein